MHRPPGPPDRAAIRREILRLAAARAPDRTACPSEVARALAGDWRPLMPAIREEAADLAADGRIRVTQKGAPVDAISAKGPIRLSLA